MDDKRDDAYNKLRLYFDKNGRKKSEHQVDKSRTIRPSNPKDFKDTMGFTLYVSLRAELNSRKLAFHLVIA